MIAGGKSLFKRIVVSAIIAFGFASVALAELTPQEKAELRKLYEANAGITQKLWSLQTSGAPTFPFTGAKLKLNFALFHLLSGAAGQIPETTGLQALREREEDLRLAFNYIDGAIAGLKQDALFNGEVAILQGFNRALPYADAVSGIFALQDDNLPGGDPEIDQTQFGPHGHYSKALRELWTVSIYANSSYFSSRDFALSQELIDYRIGLARVVDCVSRIMGLSAHVSLILADDAVVNDPILRPLREISLATQCAAVDFRRANTNLAEASLDLVATSGMDTRTLMRPIGHLSSSWRALDHWMLLFLDISEIPIQLLR